jgi:hypothetical protein
MLVHTKRLLTAAMHPAGYCLAQAHLTRLRHQTQRAGLARSARTRPRLGGHFLRSRIRRKYNGKKKSVVSIPKWLESTFRRLVRGPGTI